VVAVSEPPSIDAGGGSRARMVNLIRVEQTKQLTRVLSGSAVQDGGKNNHGEPSQRRNRLSRQYV
jgi:hypothetical protein